jgi:hypothetical protein
MGGWTASDVCEFVDARAGGGGVWEYSGELVSMANGRVLAGISGVEEVVSARPLRAIPKPPAPDTDIATATRHSKPAALPGAAPRPLPGSPHRIVDAALTHSARIITRKTIFYTDPNTGAKLDTFRYRPTAPPRAVYPIVSPATALDVALDTEMRLVLTRAAPPKPVQAPTTVAAIAAAAAAVASARLTVTAPPLRPIPGLLSANWTYVGVNVAARGDMSNKTPNRPGVIEEYSYTAGRKGGAACWVRVGKCPSWYGGGQCMMSVRSMRVKGGREGLDNRLRQWLTSVGRSVPLTLEDATKAVAEQQQQAATSPLHRRRLLGLF